MDGSNDFHNLQRTDLTIQIIVVIIHQKQFSLKTNILQINDLS